MVGLPSHLEACLPCLVLVSSGPAPPGWVSMGGMEEAAAGSPQDLPVEAEPEEPPQTEEEEEEGDKADVEMPRGGVRRKHDTSQRAPRQAQ